MKSDEDKAKDIIKKRRLAAKGIKPTPGDTPLDPTDDFDALDPADRRIDVVTSNAAVAAAALKKSG